MAAGYARFEPCLAGGWGASTEFAAACYSDVEALYQTRGAQFPALPYRNYIFEYPVGIGAFAYTAAAITAGVRALTGVGGDTLVYFTVSAVLLAACALAAIWLTTRMPGARSGDALYLAAGMAMMGFINWDLLAVALTAAALYAFSREQPLACGVLLGFGTASKTYPALLLVPLLLICVRERRLRSFGVLAAGAALTWLVLNAPYVVGPLKGGWTLFYTFSFHRDADLGTLWNLLSHVFAGHWPGHELDLLVAVSLLACTAGICALALLAPRAPSLGQLSFLMLASFLLTSKSWSPQYGLWLLPFVVLTRLSWAVLGAWLALDIAFYLASMWYVNFTIHGPGPELNLTQDLSVVSLHWLALAAMCGLLIRALVRREPTTAAAA